MSNAPYQHAGLCGLAHLALRVSDLERSRHFYEHLLGMQVVWAPDPENVYLTLGPDNLALHQIPQGESLSPGGTLDHFGFIVENEAFVDAIAKALIDADVPILKQPRRHRDGSYSFYFSDPDGNVIQMLYEPRRVDKSP